MDITRWSILNTVLGTKKDNTNTNQPSKETYGPCAPDTYTWDDLRGMMSCCADLLKAEWVKIFELYLNAGCKAYFDYKPNW